MILCHTRQSEARWDRSQLCRGWGPPSCFLCNAKQINQLLRSGMFSKASFSCCSLTENSLVSRGFLSKSAGRPCHTTQNPPSFTLCAGATCFQTTILMCNLGLIQVLHPSALFTSNESLFKMAKAKISDFIYHVTCHGDKKGKPFPAPEEQTRLV